MEQVFWTVSMIIIMMFTSYMIYANIKRHVANDVKNKVEIDDKDGTVSPVIILRLVSRVYKFIADDQIYKKESLAFRVHDKEEEDALENGCVAFIKNWSKISSYQPNVELKVRKRNRYDGLFLAFLSHDEYNGRIEISCSRTSKSILCQF